MLPERTPQTFEDWLLLHGDAREFQEVGLTANAAPIISVCVFDADTVEGIHVAESLLENDRTRSVTAVFSDFDSEPARRLYAMDPERVRLASMSETRDETSLKKLLGGIDGVFMMTDMSDAGILHRDEGEELHAINIIDACEICSVRHIIFCTTENIIDMQHELKWTSDNEAVGDDSHFSKSETTKARKPLRSITQIEAYLHEQLKRHPKKLAIDAKARIAAYAKSEHITVTFVILPLYPENFFDLVTKTGIMTNTIGDAAIHFVPEKEESLLACMSLHDLGRAVARIFDFYEEYAGHEIGLATDFITIREVAQVVREVFFDTRVDNGNITSNKAKQIAHLQHVHEQMQVEGSGNRTIDLGAIFGFCSQSDAVQKRHCIAKVLDLCPEPTTFKMWMNENKYNPAFREKLGLR